MPCKTDRTLEKSYLQANLYYIALLNGGVKRCEYSLHVEVAHCLLDLSPKGLSVLHILWFFVGVFSDSLTSNLRPHSWVCNHFATKLHGKDFYLKVLSEKFKSCPMHLLHTPTTAWSVDDWSFGSQHPKFQCCKGVCGCGFRHCLTICKTCIIIKHSLK